MNSGPRSTAAGAAPPRLPRGPLDPHRSRRPNSPNWRRAGLPSTTRSAVSSGCGGEAHGRGRPAVRVSISQQELQKLQRWGEWARQQGALDDYLVALKTINFRLAFEPAEWGEPRYTLRELGLEVRLGTFKMLNVWYGVSEAQRVVFVKVFQFRGDYAHGSPPESP